MEISREHVGIVLEWTLRCPSGGDVEIECDRGHPGNLGLFVYTFPFPLELTSSQNADSTHLH
jgi:hypothetical protein